jgi:hypothetical protein
MFTPRETRRRTSRRALALIATAIAGLAASAVIAPAAVARPVERGTFHFGGTEVVDDFCGQAGLTMTLNFVVDGRFFVNARKPGTLPYGIEMDQATETTTNDAGESTTSVRRVTMKDLKITDNGDGTATILVLVAGSNTLYDDSTGKAIDHSPGQLRFEILIDENGTPSDPTDDQFLDFLGVVKMSPPPTSRVGDDFCPTMLEVLG